MGIDVECVNSGEKAETKGRTRARAKAGSSFEVRSVLPPTAVEYMCINELLVCVLYTGSIQVWQTRYGSTARHSTAQHIKNHR